MIFLSLLSNKKGLLLILLLSLLSGTLLLFNFVVLPLKSDCLFDNFLVCLSGGKYEKYNWKGEFAARAYKLKDHVRVKAPLDGWFVYSPSGTINFQGKEVGVTPVLVFRSEKEGMIKLYVAEANLLKGQVAVEQEVKKGELVAEILPGKIGFLDNYSLVMVRMIK